MENTLHIRLSSNIHITDINRYTIYFPLKSTRIQQYENICITSVKTSGAYVSNASTIDNVYCIHPTRILKNTGKLPDKILFRSIQIFEI